MREGLRQDRRLGCPLPDVPPARASEQRHPLPFGACRVTLSIEYPPDRKACARCQSPLTWLYSPRTGKWLGVVVDVDVDLIRVHRCPQYPGDRPQPSWREVREIDPATARAGAALVREVLANTSKEIET